MKYDFDSKRRVPVRLHIDHLDNPEKDIWAIDVLGRRYLTARSGDVTIAPTVRWRLCGPRRRQPRAYLLAYARVTVSGDHVFLQ